MNKKKEIVIEIVQSIDYNLYELRFNLIEIPYSWMRFLPLLPPTLDKQSIN